MPETIYRPALPARPGALGIVAGAAIAVAVLSMLASLLSGGYAVGVYASSRFRVNALLRHAPPALPASLPQQPVRMSAPVTTPVGPRGMEPPRREKFIAALQQRIQLSPEQSRQLDALLADAGQEIFPLAGSPDEAVGQIGDRCGRLATTALDASPFYFENSAGRVEVYADRALFYRANSPSIVRASSGRRLNLGGRPMLLEADVHSLIDLAQQSSGGALNDAQVTTLRQLLSDPQQNLVALSSGAAGEAIGLNSATVRHDGYAIVSFAGGPLLLGPRGDVILQGDAAGIPAVNPWACGLVVAEAIASILLAVLLLIAGVRLRRRPHLKLRPFHTYGILKVILAVGGGAAMGWMIASYLDAAGPAPGGAADSRTVESVIVGALFAAAGCAFPIFVEVVLQRRSVREFQALFE